MLNAVVQAARWLTWAGRALFLVLGIVMMVDAALPNTSLVAHVGTWPAPLSQQAKSPDTNATNSTLASSNELHYTVGTVNASCELDHVAQAVLKNDDLITVERSRIFKSCQRITRGQELIFQSWAYARLVQILAGLFLILNMCVWTPFDNN